MARVFKRKYRKKLSNGETELRVSQKWHVEYRDADGIRRSKPAFRDKIASQQFAAQLEKEAELAAVGIVDRYATHRKRPLSEHLADFKNAILNKGTTAKQAQQVFNRCNSILKACRMLYINDISASRIQTHLAERRKEGLGVRSSNFYLQAIKQFCKWMVADNRTDDNPVAYLSGANPNLDVRHGRRALANEEVEALLKATLSGNEHHNMDGRTRYMLYVLALSTGFRASELHSLKWASIDLGLDNSCVTVAAGYTKNKKEARLPLRQDIAGLLREWKAENGFAADEKVFSGFNKSRGASMLRKDLEAAGVPYQDESGRFADFHALRHSFITNVVKSGATAKESQVLARHSKVELTLGIYAHLGISDERRALENLPTIPGVGENDREKNRDVVLRTGTDNRPVDIAGDAPKKLTAKLTAKSTETAYSGCDQSATNGTTTMEQAGKGVNHNFLNGGTLDKKKASLASAGNEKRRGGDSNPRYKHYSYDGLANRYLKPLGHLSRCSVYRPYQAELTSKPGIARIRSTLH